MEVAEDLDQERPADMCPLPALFRYTWPGKAAAYICHKHVTKLHDVAVALGMHLQVIKLDQRELLQGTLCEQHLSTNELAEMQAIRKAMESLGLTKE